MPRGFKGTNDGVPDIFRNWLRFQEIIDLVVGYTVRIFIRALGSDQLKIGRGHFEDEGSWVRQGVHRSLGCGVYSNRTAAGCRRLHRRAS